MIIALLAGYRETVRASAGVFRQRELAVADSIARMPSALRRARDSVRAMMAAGRSTAEVEAFIAAQGIQDVSFRPPSKREVLKARVLRIGVAYPSVVLVAAIGAALVEASRIWLRRRMERRRRKVTDHDDRSRGWLHQVVKRWSISRAISLAAVLLSLGFLMYVWPTPYRQLQLLETNKLSREALGLRQQRFTGRVEVLTVGGWTPIERFQSRMQAGAVRTR